MDVDRLTKRPLQWLTRLREAALRPVWLQSTDSASRAGPLTGVRELSARDKCSATSVHETDRCRVLRNDRFAVGTLAPDKAMGPGTKRGWAPRSSMERLTQLYTKSAIAS
jgi:hypothetical protein